MIPARRYTYFATGRMDTLSILSVFEAATRDP